MGSSYRNTLDQWLSQLEVKANILLDIGGAQLPLPNRVKSWDVNKYIIGDLSKPHADSQKPDIIFDLNEYFAWGMPMYDTIFCLEVFEYVYDPMTAMKNIEHVLTSGGTAWVTFPSFYPTHQPIEDDSLRYMEGGIRKLADAAGLTIVEMIRRRPETNALQNFFSIERLRAAKGYDHAFMGFIVRFTK